MNTNRSNVKRVYSGKPGCMCGCRGKYSEEGRGVSVIYNKVMSHPDVKIEGDYAFVVTETRNWVVYFGE